MSKERLEETKKWLGQMRLILSSKTDKDEMEYVQSKIDLFEWLIEQSERFEVLAEQHDETLAQNKRYREAWKKAKIEAKEHGAGKADEDITDDGKEDAYNQGAQDMYDDFVYEYERALESES